MSAVTQMALLAGKGGAPPTSYANTGGTGARTGVITATSTFTPGASTPAGLVDGSFANLYWVTSQGSGLWKFDFGVGATKYIDEITWYQDIANAQGFYTFEGSNDDSAYTNISTGIALGGSSATQITPLSPLTTSLWRYFRLRLTSGVTSSGSFQHEVEFKISA